MQGWKAFLEKKKWSQGNNGKHILQAFLKLKKSDWAVLALVGVLLLVIAIPAGDSGTAEKSDSRGSDTASERSVSSDGAASDLGDRETTEIENGAASSGGEAYVAYLEEKLERVLSQMEGVGEVEVMITVSDAGEYVVEKDRNTTKTVTQENDSAGGSRTVTEGDTEEQTVYVDTADETYPYIQKEKMPTVEGVVVVAEGGGSSVVISNISEAVEALLPVEAHRIKVVKMCSKEE